MRKNHTLFRMDSSDEVRKNLKFMNSPYNTVAFRLSSHTESEIDKKDELLVLYNPNREYMNFEIPEAKWGTIVDDRQAGKEPFNIFTKNYVIVPPISVMVLVSQ